MDTPSEHRPPGVSTRAGRGARRGPPPGGGRCPGGGRGGAPAGAAGRGPREQVSTTRGCQRWANACPPTLASTASAQENKRAPASLGDVLVTPRDRIRSCVRAAGRGSPEEAARDLDGN